jgi:hypothetical protein
LRAACADECEIGDQQTEHDNRDTCSARRRPADPKIQFYKTIKTIERHPNLDDPNVILNSFIISNTPFREVSWWEHDMSKTDLEQSHVLFQKEDRGEYVKSMLSRIVSGPN